jgi:Holliday junction DNA helicase RuvA
VIALLRGQLLEKHPNRVIVDVQGVGYDVFVPLSTFWDMKDAGSAVTLRIHTHVREDALQLYGFATDVELQIFERLIAISGIGPKVALAVLSGIEPDDLIRAVRTGDIARLTSIPGIGKKTAERITLELRDRLPASIMAPRAAGAAADDPAAALRDDLLSALMNLGYHRPLAEKAVDAALKEEPGAAFETTFRRALRHT